MRTISRKEAKSANLPRYFTGIPCKRGHIAERFVSIYSCVECMKIHFKEWRSKNLERDRADSRAWQKSNPAKVREHIANREAGIAQRMPSWADRTAIRRIYSEAVRVSIETGIKHHVDHEIPLFGKRVSGLHIANNLRVITAEQNKKKSNLFAV